MVTQLQSLLPRTPCWPMHNNFSKWLWILALRQSLFIRKILIRRFLICERVWQERCCKKSWTTGCVSQSSEIFPFIRAAAWKLLWLKAIGLGQSFLWKRFPTPWKDWPDKHRACFGSRRFESFGPDNHYCPVVQRIGYKVTDLGMRVRFLSGQPLNS